MKTNISLLRGYDNSHSDARTVAKAGAPSALAYKAKRKVKIRKSYFSNPDLYTLPYVDKSNKR